MRRIAAAAALVALLTGCGATAEPVGFEPPSASPSPSAEPAENRTAAVYAPVIRAAVTRDHMFGSARNVFSKIYVLDHPDSGIFSNRDREPQHEAFSPATRQALLLALADLPPMEFVSSADEVDYPVDFKRPIERHVLVTLGLIVGDGNRVEVANRLRCGNDCGLAQTHVVERGRGRWQTTGTTGPQAIA